jgi:hypothetical protein
MALESETVETLEAAALQLSPAERARLVDRLIAPSMLIRKSKKLGQRRSSVGNLKSKMEQRYVTSQLTKVPMIVNRLS